MVEVGVRSPDPLAASQEDGALLGVGELPGDDVVEGEIEELYDLESDPEELTNLAQEKSQAARVAKMRADTIAELKRTDAGFADALPSVATANEK